MRKNIFFVLGLFVLTVSGCDKNNQKVESAKTVKPVNTPDVSKNDDPSVEIHEKKVAKGDMEELLISLERIHFAFDEASLSDTNREALRDVAKKLRKYPNVSLYVDGHTDRRGTTEYNLSLGDRRAKTVIDFLNHMGIDRSRLKKVSFGEEVPLKRGTSHWVFAKNRRVGFRVMEGDVELVLEEGTLLSDNGKPLDQVTHRN